MAAVGESGPQPDSDDPYARLGLSAGASFEQVQSAKQRCLSDADDDPQARARIEAAYDAVLMARLRDRQQGQLSAAAREHLQDQEELRQALEHSGLALLDASGAPLGAGDLLEIFVGLQPLPPGFDWRIGEAEAADLSGAMADLLSGGQPWRQCRELVMQAYPPQKKQRRERFAEVMAGLRDYGAAELDAELPDLLLTLQGLGIDQALVAAGPEALLERLRQPR